MTAKEKTAWKDWLDELRQAMMTGLTAEVTKSVDEITSVIDTTKNDSTLRTERFWRACQLGESPNDVLAKAGFEIEFQPDENRTVQEVTLQLNDTWMTILNRVLERNKA
jgi:hypothetical protein